MIANRPITSVNLGRQGDGRGTRGSKSLMIRASRERQSKSIDELKREIWEKVSAMGLEAALLPGSHDEKKSIMDLIEQLPSSSSSSASSDETMAGEWELVYTSNGTVVTRTPVIQAISLASKLPGTGIKRISQKLEAQDAGNLKVLNLAVIGFGPFGEWRLGIEGDWTLMPDDSPASISHRVKFRGLAAKPTGILGIDLPDIIPQISLSLPEAARGAGATWVTTFCDEEFRIGQGASSGNTFLFFKSTDSKS
jgi:hypothetical protein